jgi:hypothetical protein
MKQNLQRLFIALLAMMMMPIGNYSLVFAQDIAEAKWGTSASELPNSGTLAEAISAAGVEGSTVKYIQLQKDLNKEDAVTIEQGVFTLDLNGQTISSSDNYTLNIREKEVEEGEESQETQVTLTDSSTEGKGKVICSLDAASAVVVSVPSFSALSTSSVAGVATSGVEVVVSCGISTSGTISSTASTLLTNGWSWYSFNFLSSPSARSVPNSSS